jgi:hypothetical protein
VIIGQKERHQTRIPGNGFRSWLGWRAAVTALLFLIIPILFVIAVTQLTKAKGPQWLPYTFENPYAYLFNSLLVVKGEAPHSIEHPGTTTQVFGAIILRASSVQSTDDLIASVIQNPEKHIRKLHWALLIFTALVLWICPWITAIVLRNYIVGLLIQAPSLFYQSLLWYGILFGSDLMLVPFSIAAVCCCTLLVTPSAVAEKLEILFGIGNESAPPGSVRLMRIRLLAALTGLVCAFGIVTKLTFFPLILISLLFCRNLRNLATFATAFVLGLAVALLPIYSQLWRMGTWIFNLGIHSGQYGAGSVGLPETGEYLKSLWNLLETEPLVGIIPIVTLIAALVGSFSAKGQRHSRTFSWGTVLSLFGLQLISFLAIAKHPGRHYLIPLCLSTGLSLVLLFYVFQITNGSVISRAIGWLTLVGLLVLGFKDFIELTPETYAELRNDRTDQLRLYQHAKEITKNDVRIDYFFSDSPEYPMCYANGFSGGAFQSLLVAKYPHALFFNVFNGMFETFTDFIEPEVELQRYDHLYFLGNPKFLRKVDGLDPKTFETIDHAGDYYLQKWTRK